MSRVGLILVRRVHLLVVRLLIVRELLVCVPLRLRDLSPEVAGDAADVFMVVLHGIGESRTDLGAEDDETVTRARDMVLLALGRVSFGLWGRGVGDGNNEMGISRSLNANLMSGGPTRPKRFVDVPPGPWRDNLGRDCLTVRAAGIVSVGKG